MLPRFLKGEGFNMVFETTGETKINNMVLEVPKTPDFSFIPSEEFSDEEKDKIFSYAKKLKETVEDQEKYINVFFGGRNRLIAYRDYFMFCGDVAILFPKEKNKLPLDDKDLKRANETILKHSDYGYHDFSSIYGLRNLFPGENFNADIHELVYGIDRKRIDLTELSARNLKIFLPEQFDPEDYPGFPIFEEYKRKTENQTSNNMYIRGLSELRILYPEKFNQVKIKTRNMEQSSKHIHQSLKQTIQHSSLREAVTLRIASAKEVELGPNGIRFKDFEIPLKNKTPNIPEAKKF